MEEATLDLLAKLLEPNGDDYEAHLRFVKESTPEEVAGLLMERGEKAEAFALLAQERKPDAWFGKLSENVRKGWHATSGGDSSNPPQGGSGGSTSVPHPTPQKESVEMSERERLAKELLAFRERRRRAGHFSDDDLLSRAAALLAPTHQEQFGAYVEYRFVVEETGEWTKWMPLGHYGGFYSKLEYAKRDLASWKRDAEEIGVQEEYRLYPLYLIKDHAKTENTR